MNDTATTEKQPYAWTPSLPLALAGALLGGLIGFGIVEYLHPSVEPGQEGGTAKYENASIAIDKIPALSTRPTNGEAAEFIIVFRDFYSKNFALEFAIIGACIALFMVGMTVTKMRVPSAILAALLAAGAAAGAGFWAGLRSGYVLEWTKEQEIFGDALSTLAIWTAMAVGIALGATLLQGNMQGLVKSLASALVAGIFVAVAILVVFSLAFSSAELADHVPVLMVERIAWIVVASLTMGLAFAIGMKPDNRGKEQVVVSEEEAEASAEAADAS